MFKYLYKCKKVFVAKDYASTPIMRPPTSA